ncbi:MAG: hypothetical protein MUO76_04065, partial [Anaerolineaceae bacterium]|nr:hypothetical protein [Anaerolineaceae bacterium]
ESGILPLKPHLEKADQSVIYNKLNQVISRGDDTYTYDADGNLTKIAGEWAAAYDAENRLVELTRSAEKTQYIYNGLGRRVKSISDDVTRQYYHNAAGLLLCEADEVGKITASYIYRGNLLCARVNASGETHFYHFDKTGSTLALTDENGKVCASYAYEPFGGVISVDGATDGNPFTYVGQYGVMDEGDGLYFMTRRYYDAHTGRFIQKDPIGIRGGLNLYAYTMNNPVTGIDPQGTLGGIAVVCIAGLIVAAVLCGGYGAAQKKIPKTPFGIVTNVNRDVVDNGRVDNPTTPDAIKNSPQAAFEAGLIAIEEIAESVPPFNTMTAVFRAGRKAWGGDYQGAVETFVSAFDPVENVRHIVTEYGHVKHILNNCDGDSDPGPQVIRSGR